MPRFRRFLFDLYLAWLRRRLAHARELLEERDQELRYFIRIVHAKWDRLDAARKNVDCLSIKLHAIESLR
jgi:hypothetical protein